MYAIIVKYNNKIKTSTLSGINKTGCSYAVVLGKYIVVKCNTTEQMNTIRDITEGSNLSEIKLVEIETTERHEDITLKHIFGYNIQNKNNNVNEHNIIYRYIIFAKYSAYINSKVLKRFNEESQSYTVALGKYIATKSKTTSYAAKLRGMLKCNELMDICVLPLNRPCYNEDMLLEYIRKWDERR